jgi:hypothetical protein
VKRQCYDGGNGDGGAMRRLFFTNSKKGEAAGEVLAVAIFVKYDLRFIYVFTLNFI